MKRIIITGILSAFLAGPVVADTVSCTDCVEVFVKRKGDLVYDPIFGVTVNERPPLPLAEDACIERDYFDRCLRRANNPKPTDVYVKAQDGRLIRTEAVGARVIPNQEAVITRSPGKTGDLRD